MAKKKKEEEKGKSSYILIFVLIGFILGGTLGFIYYGKLFEAYVVKIHSNVEEDYNKMENYLNMIVDQVIKLKKMLIKDKIKFNVEMFDTAIDLRSQLLGADNLEEKINLIKQLDPVLNNIIEFYNIRMDLRNKRFGYIEWGMFTKKYIDRYIEHKNKYEDEAMLFNEKIKKFPFSRIAKKKKFSSFPVLGNEIIKRDIKLNTEKYEKKNK